MNCEPYFPETRKISFNSLITSITIFLCLFGYPIFAAIISIFVGDASFLTDSSIYTWPYRGASVVFFFISLFFVKRNAIKMNWKIALLFVFLIMHFFRTFYDIEVRDISEFRGSLLAWRIDVSRFRTWNYVILLTALPLFAVYRTFYNADFSRILNWIIVLSSIGLIVSIARMELYGISIYGDDSVARVNATDLLNTISYGHLGGSLAILSLYQLVSNKRKAFPVLYIATFLLGVFVLLRAGSRGPIFSISVVLFMWWCARSRYAFIALFVFSAFAGCVYFFRETIFNLIMKISPVLVTRINMTLEYGHSSGRDYLMKSVIDKILENPLFGVQTDQLGYSHNAILDGFMMFGIGAGWIVFVLYLTAYVDAYKVIKLKIKNYWVALLAIQYFTATQTSFSLGGNCQVLLFMLIVYAVSYQLKNQNSYIK